jgi:hypothetical protein
MARYRSQTEYLGLARFCQRLIESLFEYLDEPGKAATINDSLREQLVAASSSLEKVTQGDLYQFGQRKAVAFNSYSQVRTLVEVLGSDDEITKAVGVIRQMLEGQSGQRARAKQLIDLFSRLRAKALWDFEQTQSENSVESSELSPAH